jgi:formylglycine-generating enzyme required for sulfatase activity
MGSDYVCELMGSEGSCRSHASLEGPGTSNRCGGGRIEVAGGTLLAADDTEHGVDGFCLDRSEVAVANYALCVRELGDCGAPAAGNYFVQGRDTHPINGVTPEQAASFCESLGARLPSTFEWQWAARGGELGLPYPWGDAAPQTSDAPSRVCALDDASQDTCLVLAHDAGNSSAGFADLAGNVAELVTTETEPCLAGGSFASLDAAELTTSSCAPYSAPGPTVGFRCAASLP